MEKISYPDILEARRVLERSTQAERLDPSTEWTVFDSHLNTYSRDLSSVIGNVGLDRYLMKWQNTTQQPIILLDLGSSGRNLARELRATGLNITHSLAVGLTDPRKSAEEKNEDDAIGHHIQALNLWRPSSPKDIAQSLPQKPNVVLMHITGGLKTIPQDLNFNLGMMQRYNGLTARNGIFIGQLACASSKPYLRPLEEALYKYQERSGEIRNLVTNITTQEGSGGVYLLASFQKAK